jgi:tetratricopeptide (TPR) repeat protein
MFAALPYHLIVCLSNPSWQHSSHVTHPLNYFAPTAPLLAIAGLRQLARCSRLALVCISTFALMVVLACLWWSSEFIQGYESIYCRDIAPVHGRHYAYAIGDYFIRRADAFSRQGDFDAMAREAEKVLKLDYYRGVRDEHLDLQRAHAHHLIGCNHARRKEFDAAITNLRQALELNPRLTAASISLAGCLLDTGQSGAALDVIQGGLRLAPESAELSQLRAKATSPR